MKLRKRQISIKEERKRICRQWNVRQHYASLSTVVHVGENRRCVEEWKTEIGHRVSLDKSNTKQNKTNKLAAQSGGEQKKRKGRQWTFNTPTTGCASSLRVPERPATAPWRQMTIFSTSKQPSLQAGERLHFVGIVVTDRKRFVNDDNDLCPTKSKQLLVFKLFARVPSFEICLCENDSQAFNPDEKPPGMLFPLVCWLRNEAIEDSVVCDTRDRITVIVLKEIRDIKLPVNRFIDRFILFMRMPGEKLPSETFQDG